MGCFLLNIDREFCSIWWSSKNWQICIIPTWKCCEDNTGWLWALPFLQNIPGTFASLYATHYLQNQFILYAYVSHAGLINCSAEISNGLVNYMAYILLGLFHHVALTNKTARAKLESKCPTCKQNNRMLRHMKRQSRHLLYYMPLRNSKDCEKNTIVCQLHW